MAKKPAKPRIFYYFLRHYHKIAGIMETALKDEGLTAGQYTTLSALARHEPCTSAELARGQGITAQSMGMYLTALEVRGLIDRSYQDGNRRDIIVCRSSEGIKVQQRCDRLVVEAENAYISSIPRAERAQFMDRLIALYRQ